MYFCAHRRIDDFDTGEAAEELLQEYRRTQGRGQDRHDAQLGGQQLPAGDHRGAQLLQQLSLPVGAEQRRNQQGTITLRLLR